MSKRVLQIIAVALILVVPGLVVTFCHLAGTNIYKELPYFGNPLGIAPNGDTIRHVVPEWTFQDEEGKAFGSRNLDDNIYVANFFFTRCPGPCLEMTKQLKRVQEWYEKVPVVQIVSFSVDPKYDSVSALKAYAKKMDADKKNWHFIHAPMTELKLLMEKGFLVIPPHEADDPDDFVHTEIMVLVDKGGRIRGMYNGTDKKEVDRLIDEIRVLQLNYERKHTK